MGDQPKIAIPAQYRLRASSRVLLWWGYACASKADRLAEVARRGIGRELSSEERRRFGMSGAGVPGMPVR